MYWQVRSRGRYLFTLVNAPKKHRLDIEAVGPQLDAIESDLAKYAKSSGCYPVMLETENGFVPVEILYICGPVNERREHDFSLEGETIAFSSAELAESAAIYERTSGKKLSGIEQILIHATAVVKFLGITSRHSEPTKIEAQSAAV